MAVSEMWCHLRRRGISAGYSGWKGREEGYLFKGLNLIIFGEENGESYL